MSITESPDERARVEAQLKANTTEQLEHDLAYWTVAARDHVAEYTELEQRQAKIGELHRESEAWIRLIADELRSRRPSRGGG